jgi:hypothetical protein
MRAGAFSVSGTWVVIEAFASHEEVTPMPWVRSHYRRPTGYGYAGPYSIGMIVLVVLGVLLLIYLITR